MCIRDSKRPILHQRTKFRKDRSNRCRDIAIFVIFQDSGHRHLGFLKIRNFNSTSAVRVQYASLYQISSKSVKRLQRWRFNGFFKMAASAILDMSCVYWDHPRRLLGGLYCCAKLGLNRCCTFDNMKVLIFCVFGLKCLFTPQKLGFWGISPPK